MANIRPVRKTWDELRKRRGLTDQNLADELGVSQPTVTRVLNGTTVPSGNFVGRACAAFGRECGGYRELFYMADR